MSSNINPVKPVIDKIKVVGNLRNDNINSMVKAGYKKIKKENITILREVLKYGELPQDIIRELNRLDKITKQELCCTQKNKQTGIKEHTDSSKVKQKKIILYLQMIQKGLENEEYLSDKQVEYLKQYIDDCILQLIEDVNKTIKKEESKKDSKKETYIETETENKKEIYIESEKEVEKVGENIMNNTLRITRFCDEINDFLIDSTEAIYDDFNILENDNYYKYITVDKEETFRIHSDECRYVYRILQDPVSKAIYYMSISSESDLDIKRGDSMEEIISLIFNDMNNDEFINLDTIKRKFITLEDEEEPRVIYFDTKETFCEKIHNLIN